ncbi:hypothetical protein AVEN_268923-1 [Araneus ventricosus]|uniref:Uncharacterized protein n=1 Tax=Araneus ventricosus TaxID=182803 RepID=A0A4Y2KWP3_ARAVE|nr:hypothetical protein AVEN_268923-1 [Araneus ventricosus]
MNGNQIHFILSRDPHTSPFFSGIFASDTIPMLKEKSAIVVNADKSSEPGSDWLAFYQEADNVEFFYSYGNPPEFYGPRFQDFTSNYSSVYWNSTTLQSLTSNVCGAYCIYFILKRCQGHSLYSIVSNLSHCQKNDFRMYQFVKKTLCCKNDF